MTTEAEGTLLGGRYRVSRELGVGGMATVYLADDVKSRREVALKVLKPFADDDTRRMERRFRREFEACSRLRHPNIVRLFDFGCTDSGKYYYAMEYLAQPTLLELLEGGASLEERRVLALGRQILDALVYYHRQDVVHRDIKPSNVIVDGDRPVMTDFGLVFDARLTRMTATGTILGTPRYMSPELAMGEEVDGRSDLFQFGALVFEMLTGRRVIAGECMQDVLDQIALFQPPRPSEVKSGLQADWDTFLAKCMAREVEERYATAQDALDDWELLERNEALSSVDLARETGPQVRVGSRAPATTGWAVQAGAVAIVALVALLAFWSTSSSQRHHSVYDLQISAAATRLAVTWRSDEAYPSCVRVRGPSGAVAEGVSWEATTSHEVVITGLAPKVDYDVRVVFPSDETSMPRTVRTNPASVCIMDIEHKADGLLLSLHLDPSGPSTLLLTTAKGEVERVETNDTPEGGCEVLVAKLPETTVDMTLLTRTVSGATLERTLNQEISREATRLARDMGRFALGDVLDDIDEYHSPPPDYLLSRYTWAGDSVERTALLNQERDKGIADERKKLTRTLRRKLDESPGAKAYYRVRAAAPLLFGTRLLSTELRERLFKNSRPFVRLTLFSHFEEMAADVALGALPDVGDRALSLTVPPGQPQRTVVFDGSPTPVDVGLVHPFSRETTREEWHWQMVVHDVESVAAASLAFEVQGLFKSIIELQVGPSFSTLIYGAPLLNIDASQPVQLVQRLPVDLLQEGANRLTLRDHRLFGHISARRAKISRIELLVWRSGQGGG